MAERIVTRESIAFDADAKALNHAIALVSNPRAARPLNPWDLLAHPEHHAEWAASFERFLSGYTATEGEASA